MRLLVGIASVIAVLLIVVIIQLYQLTSPTVSTEEAALVSPNTEEQLAILATRLQAIDDRMAAAENKHATARVDNEIRSVFNADEDQLNEIKARFEGLFVNYQYLKGCGATDDRDYHLLNSALMHELSSKDAPARLQYDILTAAQGTYEEIYARSDCDSGNIGQVKQSLGNYIAEVEKLGFVIKN